MESKPVAVMIGAGRWGRNILRTVMDSTTVAYIAHSGSEKTRDFLLTSYPKSAVVSDYHKTLADPAVAVAFVATPIPTHAEIVRNALCAGKHVFCEKPLALKVQDVHELYALAEQHNRTLMTGYLYLFDAGFISLCERARTAQHIEADLMWKKYGTFEYPLIEQLLVHELAILHELLGSITLEAVEQNEENVFIATISGERGRGRIHIDRTEEQRVKRVAVRIDGVESVHEWTQPGLLDSELASFLSDIKNGSANNKKRQQIDESIAAVLEVLPRPS